MRPPRRAAGESGLTLVEMLVTVAIMGIAFAVMVGGLGVAVLGSDIHRKQADVEAILRSFAENVKARDYMECATPALYASAAPTVGPKFETDVRAVEFAPPPFNAFVGDCHGRLMQPSTATSETFANPREALVIEQAPPARTADATLAGATLSASITLGGYNEIPAGTLTGVVLRVKHAGTGVGPATITVSRPGGSSNLTVPVPDELREDRVPLAGAPPDPAAWRGVTVTYSVSRPTGSLSGSAALDGIWLEATYDQPQDSGLQRVTLEARSVDDRASQDVQVTLRKAER